MLNCALIVFVKTPIPGKVKTRLIPPLSPEIASNIYMSFILDIFNRLKELNYIDLHFFYPEDPKEDVLKEILPAQKNWHHQFGLNLGEKMTNAFNLILKSYKKVLIIGSDSPDLPISYVKKAFDVLTYTDVCIGKSMDGGYYLLGMKKLQSDIFNEINWSTEKVYLETLNKCRENNLEIFELPEWYDIDTIIDLNKFYKKNDSKEYPNIFFQLEKIKDLIK